MSMMQSEGSYSHANPNKKVQLANYAPNNFMRVFGVQDGLLQRPMLNHLQPYNKF